MEVIKVDSVTEGLRQSEAVASFSDYHGKKHFIRVERDFLIEDVGSFCLPVAVIRTDATTHASLIQLPHEAETGANRLWISGTNVVQLESESAR